MRGEQPQHEGHLDLIVEREPVGAQGDKVSQRASLRMGHPLPWPTEPLDPYHEMKMSVKVSTAMKSAKTIQYIIHFTCGHRGSIGWGLRGLCLPTMLGVLWGKGHTQDLNFA